MTTTTEGLILIAFIFLALVPTIAMFALKSGRQILGFTAAGAWLLLGIFAYTKHTATWDIEYALFWLSMIMVLACSLIPLTLRENTEYDVTVDDVGDDDDKEIIRENESIRRDQRRFKTLYGTRKHQSLKRWSKPKIRMKN